MKVNAHRIEDIIKKLSQLTTTPGDGVSRFSYSEEDKSGRKIITDICEEMDLSVDVDAIGNLRARYSGTNDSLAPIWIGSHLDSVKNGGAYDGICGVVSSLEVLRTLCEGSVKFPRSIELVIFAEEEGSNFGTTMLGSKAMVGKCDEKYLRTLRNEAGRSAYDVIEDFGLNPAELDTCRIHEGDIYAMIELHIEQGKVLDEKKLKIGVVEAIAGMHTYKITIEGSSDHAGATPMNMRKDPMVASAKLITALEEYANEDTDGTAVATVGSISCLPGMSNVIADSVQFTVDIRDVKESGINEIVASMEKRCAELESECGVEITIDLVGKSACIGLSSRISDIIEECVKEKGLSYRRMNSGAVHDSAMLASITDVGMIFIPSIAGKSHCPDEYTPYDDIAAGANVLLDAVKILASK